MKAEGGCKHREAHRLWELLNHSRINAPLQLQHCAVSATDVNEREATHHFTGAKPSFSVCFCYHDT